MVSEIFEFAKKFKVTFFNLFVCTVVANFLSMAFPFLLSKLIDEVFTHENKNFYVMVILAYIVIYLMQASMLFVQVLVWTYLTNRFLFDIRLRLFQKIQYLKAKVIQSKLTGDLATIINKDTDEIMDFIHINYFNIIINYVQLIACIIFVLAINVKIALLLFILVPIVTCCGLYFGKRVKTKMNIHREKYGKHISWVYEILNGIREIQLINGKRSVNKKFINDISKLTRLKAKISWTELAAERVNAGICMLSSICIYAFGSQLVVKGEMTLGEITAIIWYFNLQRIILTTLSQKTLGAQGNLVAINKVLNLLSDDEEKDDFKHKELQITYGNVKFQNVVFSYEENIEVIKNANLEIHAGEKIALVGSSGSGKTTMMYLLMRFYDEYEGEITIDGHDIRKVSLRSLRKYIGIVQQEALIFNETIKYNLLLGNSKASMEDMWEACKKANIVDVIKALPEGLETVMGNKGVNLSGGQLQRLAIARIFLKNPKIIIFDEATSALDNETEKEVKKAWDELSQNRTTIIIAHRLSTIIGTDRVAVLKCGRVIAYDHHVELLKSCKHYRLLFGEQYVKQEKRAI